MSHMLRTGCLGLLGLLLLGASARSAAPEDPRLKELPEEERALKDTVDHWGLPLADQLTRLAEARKAQEKALGAKAPKGFVVGVQHAVEKVPRNKYWFKGRYATSVSIQAARNESEAFQVAVIPDVGKRCQRVTLSAQALSRQSGGGSIAADRITIYRVGFVKTVPAAYPSLYTGWWPDPLLPNAPLEIGGTDLGLFWVEVRVPRDAPPGDYRGQLLLTADGQSLPINVVVHVYDFALPDRVPFPIAVWTAAKWPWGEKMSAEQYRALLAQFLEHGVDPVSVGKESVSLDKADFSQLDANLEFCFARGLQCFEIPNSPARPEKLKPLVDHLRQKGWLEKALVYSNQDEPDADQFAAKNVPFYQQMKRLYPDLRLFLASQYHAGIDRACDIWMSDLSTGGGPAFARSHRGKAELWFYYCHLPVHVDFCRPLVQAPNMQIDNEAIEQRLALWVAWKYQTPGMFIWAGNSGWFDNELDRKNWQTAGWPLPTQPYKFPFAGLHNGNGFLLYPGPCPSIRLKLLRDGLQDYGYLQELRERVANATHPELKAKAQALLSVPASVMVDAHYFQRDPQALLDARRAIAQCIEALRK